MLKRQPTSHQDFRKDRKRAFIKKGLFCLKRTLFQLEFQISFSYKLLLSQA